MLIPCDQLSESALDGLIEEFVTRDGTDYGAEEVSMESKVQQVKSMLARDEVCIVFDEASGHVALMARDAMG